MTMTIRETKHCIPRRQGKDVVPCDASAPAAWIDQAERERAPADRRDLLPLHLASEQADVVEQLWWSLIFGRFRQQRSAAPMGGGDSRRRGLRSAISGGG